MQLVHFCVGAALARLEAETAMRCLLPMLAKMRMNGEPQRIQSLILLGHEHIELVPAPAS